MDTQRRVELLTSIMLSLIAQGEPKEAALDFAISAMRTMETGQKPRSGE